MLRRWMPCRTAEPTHGGVSAIILVLVFLFLGLTTRLFCADADGYSSFWPANAAMLVALLVLRARAAVPVLVCCLGLNIVLNQISGLSTSEGLLACVMNVVQVLLVAFPTRRFCGARTDLSRPRRQAAFGLIVFAATAVEAAIGVFVERRFLGDTSTVVGDWVQWVLCDSLGMILATPVVMLLMGRLHRRRSEPLSTMEPMVLLLGILLLTVVSFLSPHSFLFFFLYPAMVTLAFCVRPAWTLSTVLVVSILVSVFTAHDLGPIAQMSPDGPLMRQNMLQPYLWSLFLSALPANIVVGEKQRSTRRLAQMRAHLEYAATHDPLTGLVTRQLFKSTLATRLRADAGGTLLFIDLDHFKQINDVLGHQAGDTVLCQFSERMTACARSVGGEAARFGGDEFAMYLPCLVDAAMLPGAVGMVMAAARRPYHTGTGTARLTISVGGAALDAGAVHVDEIIRRADEALYAAKSAGRDDYRLHGDHGQPGRQDCPTDAAGTVHGDAAATDEPAASLPRSASGYGRPASRW